MTPVLLNVKEIAARMRCHPQTVYQLARGGDLAVIRRGSRGWIYAWESTVEDYLNANQSAKEPHEPETAESTNTSRAVAP